MERGYKGLKLGLSPEGYPRLTYPSYEYHWKEEGEEVTEGFRPEEEHGPGFYSLKSPKGVEEQGFWEPGRWPSVLAEIIPHGRVVHGTEGYRSEKASISAIFKEDHLCDACEKELGTVLVSKGRKEAPMLLCRGCLTKLKKALPKAKLKEMGIENYWYTLGKRYGVPVVRLL